jgi:hypothetical protein
MHGARFGIESVAAPLALPSYDVSLVVPRVAMMDAGIAWLVETLSDTVAAVPIAT